MPEQSPESDREMPAPSRQDDDAAEQAMYVAAFKFAALASILITNVALVWASDLGTF